MREVGDVHRELYPENAELYGENIRAKIERCLAVGDGEYDAAVRARAELSERALAALAGHDLLLAPTLSVAPPPADVDELDIRAGLTLFTFPFNALGWPALALPAEPRRRPGRVDPGGRTSRRRRARPRCGPRAGAAMRERGRRVASRRWTGSRVRALAGRRRRRDHARPLPLARSARRDEARPDARVRGRPRRRGGGARARRRVGSRRGRHRRGAGRRRRRRALDRRPDRRDEELRARRARVGDAARARAGGRGRRRRRVGAGARPPLVGGPRRGRLR